jgi:hypothetical protein
MIGWRNFALMVGLLLGLIGIVIWALGGGPVVLLLGGAVIVTSLLEPIYGRATRRPVGGQWRPTDERFVDPESGALMTVWFDPRSGERRYVADEQPSLK